MEFNNRKNEVKGEAKLTDIAIEVSSPSTLRSVTLADATIRLRNSYTKPRSTSPI